MRKCFISTLYRLIKLSFMKRRIMNNLKLQINLGIFGKYLPLSQFAEIIELRKGLII